MIKWQNVIVNEKTTIREAMRTIDRGMLRVALVCNEKGLLLGTVTDGDIRRGLLLDLNMEDLVIRVMNSNPKTVTQKESREYCLDIMKRFELLSLPIVDEQMNLIGLETLYELSQTKVYDNPVFIMAGGFGTRLRPLTDNCPKPMLKVGDKPMLEHQIRRFSNLGFRSFYISTHYMPEKIMDYFGNGESFGVKIQYVHEEEPLGTGGALGLLPKDLPNLPIIMLNGDVLTKIDFRVLLDYHSMKGADATMCVRELDYQIPFGVVEIEGSHVTGMVEKPTYRYLVNTGIYVLSPACISSVSSNEKLDMPTLLERRISDGEKVSVYTSYDYWLDIGRIADYKKAEKDIESLF
ncbi:nucleotidyltransferase family protein [Marinomonas sp. CT5]|uniref:nucleotidyltransferase family protein n=1 Tax=Marinomonas sp. CT5 TaxID=2066133 RepID=UPI001BAF8504|nr:nucleotidyltransferase family protein [Marinomonas sp. CT5]